MDYMLDTNICIYIIKRKPQAVLERFLRTKISQIGISSITLSELLYGVPKSSRPEQNQIALTQFMSRLCIRMLIPGNWLQPINLFRLRAVHGMP
jgi:tRNA(fMet)-specific endonuclease VapC